jgi:hypothetical protein
VNSIQVIKTRKGQILSADNAQIIKKRKGQVLSLDEWAMFRTYERLRSRAGMKRVLRIHRNLPLSVLYADEACLALSDFYIAASRAVFVNHIHTNIYVTNTELKA